MAFKLGSSRTPIFKQGQVESPMYSKWDKDTDASVPGTPVLRKNLKGGIMGEANNDGSIFISDKVKPGSDMEKHILMHEMVHQTDMKLGKLAYNDNCIKWNGEVHERKNGKIYYENEWAPEGSKHFPWEKMPWE
jgi:hypothetical protein